jgi:hypothetical protein
MTLTGCAQYTSWVTLLIIMMVLLLILGAATVRAETRETVNFDFAWRHSLDKSEWRHPQAAVADAPSGAVATVDTADAALPPAAAPGFDDAAWEVVDTPHDMLITGPISYSLPADQGFRSRGAGWYRKCRPLLVLFTSASQCLSAAGTARLALSSSPPAAEPLCACRRRQALRAARRLEGLERVGLHRGQLPHHQRVL